MRFSFSFLILFISLSVFSPFLKAQSISPFEPKGMIQNPADMKDKTYNFFLSKRFKTATQQRDSVHKDLVKTKVLFGKDSTQRNAIKDSLTTAFNELTKQHQTLTKSAARLAEDNKLLNKKFSEFIESSTSNTDKMNLALEQKNRELEQKNKDLEEREARLKELELVSRKQDSISKALKNLIHKALLNFNNKELTIELKNGKVYISFSDEFLFKSGSADVENKGLDALRKVAEVINADDKIGVLIEGHTDNVPLKSPRLKDNWDLSAARSLSVVRLLSESYHVSPEKLTAAGRGEFMPKASNETAEGKAKNRRIEIILTPDLSELYDMIYQ